MLIVDSSIANPTPYCPALPLPSSTPQQETRCPATAALVRPGLLLSCSPMTSPPTARHFHEATSTWPAPFFSVRTSVRTFQYTTLSSSKHDLVSPSSASNITFEGFSRSAFPLYIGHGTCSAFWSNGGQPPVPNCIGRKICSSPPVLALILHILHLH